MPVLLQAAAFGDAKGSSSIDITDVMLVVRNSAGMNPASFQQAYADVNADGSMSILDA